MLKGYKGGYRPKSGDKIEIFKQFVIDCYENQLFKSSEPYQPSSLSRNLPSSQETSAQPSAKQSPVVNNLVSSHQLPPTIVAPVVPTSIAILDLLTDDFMPKTNISTNAITTQSASRQPFDPFSTTSTSILADRESFSDFHSAPPPPPPPCPTVAHTFSHGHTDSFSDFHRAPAPPVPSSVPSYDRDSFTEFHSAAPPVPSVSDQSHVSNVS